MFHQFESPADVKFLCFVPVAAGACLGITVSYWAMLST